MSYAIICGIYMINVNPISKYKQLSHWHTKQLNQITRTHTCTHRHMQSPLNYPTCRMHATIQTTRKITCTHIRVHTHMQSSRSYSTRLMHATIQMKQNHSILIVEHQNIK